MAKKKVAKPYASVVIRAAKPDSAPAPTPAPVEKEAIKPEEATPPQEGVVEEVQSSSSSSSSQEPVVANEAAEELEEEKTVMKTKDRKAAKKKKKMKERIAVARHQKEDRVAKAQQMVGDQFLEKTGVCRYKIKMDFVPNMKVEGCVYANEKLLAVLMEEVISAQVEGNGGFMPALTQIGNVAGLPGIVGKSVALPDAHSGYGFAIGNVAAIDMSHPNAVVSPGGVGFDINCGVRLLRSNITEEQIAPAIEHLAEKLFQAIPVGVGTRGAIHLTFEDLDNVLNRGMDWLLEKGISWPEDLELCEENGNMKNADSTVVSKRAKSRGLEQAGSLGSGNHYAEIQVVDEVFDEEAATTMGLRKGIVVIMIHSGSRGLGHQVCTDFLEAMQRNSAKEFGLNDRQLSCCRIDTELGRCYLRAMAAAANFAWVNRSVMAHCVRTAFSEFFGQSARDLELFQVYDVSHNIAKIEKHTVDGEEKTVLVHRKGATRAFAPHHPSVPEKYQQIGQPVLIGGSMGTSSYVLVGTDVAMAETFGSTCHGAGRSLSRSEAKRSLSAKTVLKNLAKQGIIVKVSSPDLIAEEASEAYKDVSDVIETCHDAGISRKVVRLRPLAVIKG